MTTSNLECAPVFQLGIDMGQVIKNWEGRNLTPKFDIDIIETSCKYRECMEDFCWKPLPTAPEEYKRYLSLSLNERKDFIFKRPDFFRDKKVSGFLDSRDRIDHVNKRNKKTLTQWLEFNVSPKSKNKIQNCLKSYSGKDCDIRNFPMTLWGPDSAAVKAKPDVESIDQPEWQNSYDT